jgi:RNA polymerase sigma factor (sigma-70 family)
MTSWELLRSCAAGACDARLWEEFVRRFADRLAQGVRAGLRQAGRRPDREQIAEGVQEVYCRLLEGGGRRLRGFRGTTDGEAGEFLAKLARNVALDLARRERSAKRGGHRNGDPAGEDLLLDLADPRPTPLDAVLAGEACRGLLARCAVALAAVREPRHRRVLQLALIEGLPSREVAARCGGIARGAVDVIVFRLRRRLAGGGSARRARPPARRPENPVAVDSGATDAGRPRSRVPACTGFPPGSREVLAGQEFAGLTRGASCT